jgi:hypothetical protein
VTTEDPARQWCIDATEVLRDAATRAGRLAAAVAVDWLDDHGREWAERIDALRRDLTDASERAEDLAQQLRDLDPADPGLGSALAAALRAASATSRGSGPRLGDTSGMRVNNEHGVHIAQLPDSPPF